MTPIHLKLSKTASPRAVSSLIDRGIKAAGLEIALKGSLARFPGCTHWHVKRGRERGTMEITYVPSTKQAWIECRKGRDADWVEPASRELARFVEAGGRRVRSA